MDKNKQFICGINYWPINKAMYWWGNYDYEEVKNDFAVLASHGLKLIRIFLNWEDFQPNPDQVSGFALSHLKTTLDLAAEYGLQIMPTFFCGHMSGINWMPHWMLATGKSYERFPVFSLGTIHQTPLRNCYNDPLVRDAQLLQIREVCSLLKGHQALYAYDLGNESSNCFVPVCREQAREWLQVMTSSIRYYSGNVPVTLGMHAEDLEENRRLWPQDAALYCDFLTMHAYPFYHSWLNDDHDVDILPFMGMVAAWLGQKQVLLGEFGAPSFPLIAPYPSEDYENLKYPLWCEAGVASYYQQALPLLYQSEILGALAWCFADYAPNLWRLSPFKQNPHERHFGLFRHDGSAKAAVKAFKEPFDQCSQALKLNSLQRILDTFDRDSFYQDPKNNLQKLYYTWKQSFI